MVSTSRTCSGRVRGEHRCDGEGRDQRPQQSIAIGSRHRTEDLALNTLHGEQGDERCDGDGRGEEDRLVDLQRAGENEAQAIGPGARTVGRMRGISTEASRGELA